MATAANVVVGAPATILIGAYGAAEGASVDAGATEGGVTINYNPEHYLKTADQWLAPVGAVKTVENMTIVFNVAEANFAPAKNCELVKPIYPIAEITPATRATLLL